jgi:hypothetical protein
MVRFRTVAASFSASNSRSRQSRERASAQRYAGWSIELLISDGSSMEGA